MEINATAASVALSAWKKYDIDWSKVTKLEDVVNILRGLRITITMDVRDPNPDFVPLLPYLIEQSAALHSNSEEKP